MAPEYYRQSASNIYEQWRDEEKEVIYRGHTIPHPGDLNLHEYLYHLASLIIEEHEQRAVWIKSLRSFCTFLRKNIDEEQKGALEVIFPYRMEIRPTHTFQKKIKE